ncbi:1-acyl-sn-glycerol-3-phosphate acyltransferase [Bacillaceae bacterium Marseille-Q3522]|nr:1-acyl-sn-glycerol-3-phosphate acyltransferase [Bacillaceae bacterium Marseille-Q3522]
MYITLAYLVRGILILLGRMSVINKRVLPKNQGFVLACTHETWMDVVALATATIPLSIHYMAKKELFKHRFIGEFLRKIHAFPVDRENPGPSSIKIPVKLLKEKKIVGIFPSGTRTLEDIPLKKGAATIANLAKAPLIPAAYSGPVNLKELLSFKKIQVIYGEPISFVTADGKKKALTDVTAELSDRLHTLQAQLKKRLKS